MSHKKYKKTKRKLSHEIISKTRRKTNNRIKKVSKNKSGGTLSLSVKSMRRISTSLDAPVSASPSAASPRKRGRTSAAAAASSVSDSKKRARPNPLSDKELGELIVNEMFGNTTDVYFIQDSSRYGFILYGTIPEGVLFDTRNLLLNEALDIGSIDRGIPLKYFCMKLSLVLNVTDVNRFESYEYVDFKKVSHSKRAVSVIRSTKEAHIQKKLYDSFACMSGTSPFVPDVIAHGIFNREKLEHYISLFMSNRFAAATPREIEMGTASGIDDNVLYVLREINSWLQQKNIEDTRKKDVTEKQHWAVDILLMEYIDTKQYQTLYTLGSRSSGILQNKKTFDVSTIQTALLTSASQLACATGVGIILYDCHLNNILSNISQSDVRLIDIGGAIDLNDEGDKQSILESFDTMLKNIENIAKGRNAFCTIQELCDFFDVIIAATIVKQTKKTKQSKESKESKQSKESKESKKSNQAPYEEILKQKFEENLDTLIDFRCERSNLTLENIHHNLIMTAFIDFMIYIVVYGDDKCQSQYTMESVYGKDTFNKFSPFLTQFRPNNRRFRSSVTPPESYDANLMTVSKKISDIVKLCSSVKCPIDVKRLGLGYRLKHLPAQSNVLEASPASLASPSTELETSKARSRALEASTVVQPLQKKPISNQRGCLIM
jgi:hypothetical protein